MRQQRIDLAEVGTRHENVFHSGVMRVRVDNNVCEANAVCCGLVPQVFDLDDDDVLHILTPQVPPELEGQVRLAVAQCPKMALSIEED